MREDLQERNRSIVRMYRDGHVLREIGEKYGITRERVRQVLAQAGVSRTEGGATRRGELRRRDKEMERRRRIKRKYGCSLEFYLALMSMGEESKDSPVWRYREQKRNAKYRGIEWNLSLLEWWEIWERSGKWEQRGKQDGQYVMCRYYDSGAYEVGNVYITTCNENIYSYWYQDYRPRRS